MAGTQYDQTYYITQMVSAYNELQQEEQTTTMSDIYSSFSSAYTKLKEISEQHEKFLGTLPRYDEGNGSSVPAYLKKANEKFSSLVGSLGVIAKKSGIDDDGSVDSGSSSETGSSTGSETGSGGGSSYGGGSSSSGGSSSGGTVSGTASEPDTSQYRVGSNASSGSSSSGGSSSGSGTSSSSGGSSSPVADEFVRVESGSGSGSGTGDAVVVGATVGGGAATTAAGVASDSSSDNSGTTGDSSSSVEYPCGNYKIDDATLNNLTEEQKQQITNKLKEIGYTDEEIADIMSGKVETPQVLVDSLSDALTSTYAGNQNIRNEIIEKYGIDIFNENGSINKDKLSMVLIMDDKSGKDNYSVIGLLRDKYNVNIVDQTRLTDYTKKLESLVSSDLSIKNKIMEKYGFDVFNPDCTVNSDRLTLALLIDSKGTQDYSIGSIIADANVSSLSSALDANLVKPIDKTADSKGGSGLGTMSVIAGVGVLGAAGVGAGVAIARKNKEKDKEKGQDDEIEVNNSDEESEK